ncbi:ABC transporter substrate-binding protein [Phreatobacter aquaticus]|uniref:ABC transporter substrate-binding protein n=1 Tax=Phreatobacter aquaticus TaxID=2570229 RepID=A0A4D7QGA0_9HYPH|nr:ABC transporter substrate-binding protein [Phreatobacter aquaticus]QCK84494.1 ABC transporter substrate-binding protein [Phreatobacter aquaticus]
MPKHNPNLTRRAVVGALASLPAVGLAGRSFDAAAQAAAPKKGGTMIMVMQSEPPALLSFVNSSSIALTARSTEGLLQYDDNLKPLPSLATEWSVAPDGLTYTFKLRQGVKWHDGKDFTADDVVFSLQTVKRLHPRGRSTFQFMTSAEAIDPHTVVLKLSKPTPFLLTALAAMETAIVPKHVYGEADPLSHPNNTAPIGTGPYVFKEWVRGSHAIWERNPNYWDKDAAYLDKLIVRFILDPAARTIAFETGSVHVGYRTPVPYRDVERLKALPQIRFEPKGYAYDPPNIIIAEFNLDNPYLKDLKIRQAIAHCVDRAALCRIVFYGNAVPSASPVVPYHKEFHDARPTPYPFNVGAAQKLLDEAGHARRGNAMRFTINLDYTGEDQRPVAEFLRSSLARAGIGIDLRSQDMGTLVKRVYTDREFGIHLASISNLFDPNVGVQRLYWSKNYLRGVPFSNGTHYANAEVDGLLEQASVEPDKDKRIAAWMRVQEIVKIEVPNLPLAMATWQTIHNVVAQGHTVNAEGFEGTFSKAYMAE